MNELPGCGLVTLSSPFTDLFGIHSWGNAAWGCRSGKDVHLSHVQTRRPRDGLCQRCPNLRISPQSSNLEGAALHERSSVIALSYGFLRTHHLILTVNKMLWLFLSITKESIDRDRKNHICTWSFARFLRFLQSLGHLGTWVVCSPSRGQAPLRLSHNDQGGLGLVAGK